MIGDFPEAEARLFLEQTLGANITDAEWAEIFGVSFHARVRVLFSALSPVRFVRGVDRAAALAFTYVQVCGGNAGRLAVLLDTLTRSKTGQVVGDVCCMIMA